MRYIDLTHTLDNDTPAYPDDPTPTLTQITTIAQQGFADHTIHMSMHVGTHMDAPAHMIDSGKKLSDIPIEQFFGRGVLIDARAKSIIDVALLEEVDIQRGDIVLVLTGFSTKYKAAEYFENYPAFTDDFARTLVEKQAHAIGLDTPSPDRAPYPIHKLLLGNDVLIIENLTNLEQLIDVPYFDVIALPAKFATDGAPVRVVAMCT